MKVTGVAVIYGVSDVRVPYIVCKPAAIIIIAVKLVIVVQIPLDRTLKWPNNTALAAI
jgi:hypothetical protein